MSAGHVRHKSEAPGTSVEDRRDVLEAMASSHRAMMARVNQGTVQRRTGMTHMTVQNAIDALILSGLVDEHRVERGERNLWLTDAGWQQVGGKMKWGVFA